MSCVFVLLFHSSLFLFMFCFVLRSFAPPALGCKNQFRHVNALSVPHTRFLCLERCVWFHLMSTIYHEKYQE